ncbi:hypothetical protein VTI74DRAFT_88 [Chaetomium olivicolor]
MSGRLQLILFMTGIAPCCLSCCCAYAPATLGVMHFELSRFPCLPLSASIIQDHLSFPSPACGTQEAVAQFPAKDQQTFRGVPEQSHRTVWPSSIPPLTVLNLELSSPIPRSQVATSRIRAVPLHSRPAGNPFVPLLDYKLWHGSPLPRCLWKSSQPPLTWAATIPYRPLDQSFSHHPSRLNRALFYPTSIAQASNSTMASTDILSQTLSSITAIKLDQLQKQKDTYEAKKRSLCEDVISEVDTTKRVKKLLKGSEELQSVGLGKNKALSELESFLDQAEYDPSVTEGLLQEYEAEIHRHLNAQTNKYQFASLYGKLVEEWIASGHSAAASTPDGSGFIVVGREEMHQQRATWEEYVFKAKETDGKAIKAYLTDVFSSKEARQALEKLRESFEAFQKMWKKEIHFDEDTLETVIRGMLRSDILTEEKRTILRDFLGNRVVLSEISDVLNMRMSSIDSWHWGSPLVVEQRRNLNGRYRFYTDEDLLHSMLVYYVGLKWGLKLRNVLENFIKTNGVWKPDTKPISKADARRRRFFLGNVVNRSANSVQKTRNDHFNGILLDQLPRTFDEVRGTYGDENSQKDDTKPTHTEVVQDLLQRLQTEILMRTKFGNEITVIRSDFKWFGPSLPHSTIFAVLEFFGVNEEWRDFFKRVLEAPIRFKQDTPDVPPQLRKRGSLIGNPLGDFFGESLLFCLDFAVNQKASGTRLYRLHDDMWLWGDLETCGKAWGVVTAFTNTMGLELNLEKTGSVRVTKGNGAAVAVVRSETLPMGDVKWGFLKLDPVTGRFLIVQEEVDKHIEELRLQLSACRSVLDYVQAWNIYGNRFFLNNFGKPANCSGRDHIDSMLATFRRIQERLFPNHTGGVGEHLKRMITSRFGLSPSDIPEGFLYWPLSMGGLGLQNPFITTLLSRGPVSKNPERLIDDYLREEELEYRRAKRKFGRAGSHAAGCDCADCCEASEGESDNAADAAAWWHDKPEFDDLRDEPFMSMDEFTRYRERTASLLDAKYRQLISSPATTTLEASGEVKAALANGRTWYELSDYEKWVVQLYHRDMIARFGGLDVVDQGLLPTGLMTMLRNSRFQWQG